MLNPLAGQASAELPHDFRARPIAIDPVEAPEPDGEQEQHPLLRPSSLDVST